LHQKKNSKNSKKKKRSKMEKKVVGGGKKTHIFALPLLPKFLAPKLVPM